MPNCILTQYVYRIESYFTKTLTKSGIVSRNEWNNVVKGHVKRIVCPPIIMVNTAQSCMHYLNYLHETYSFLI